MSCRPGGGTAVSYRGTSITPRSLQYANTPSLSCVSPAVCAKIEARVRETATLQQVKRSGWFHGLVLSCLSTPAGPAVARQQRTLNCFGMIPDPNTPGISSKSMTIAIQFVAPPAKPNKPKAIRYSPAVTAPSEAPPRRSPSPTPCQVKGERVSAGAHTQEAWQHRTACAHSGADNAETASTLAAERETARAQRYPPAPPAPAPFPALLPRAEQNPLRAPHHERDGAQVRDVAAVEREPSHGVRACVPPSVPASLRRCACVFGAGCTQGHSCRCSSRRKTPRLRPAEGRPRASKEKSGTASARGAAVARAFQRQIRMSCGAAPCARPRHAAAPGGSAARSGGAGCAGRLPCRDLAGRRRPAARWRGGAARCCARRRSACARAVEAAARCRQGDQGAPDHICVPRGPGRWVRAKRGRESMPACRLQCGRPASSLAPWRGP